MIEDTELTSAAVEAWRNGNPLRLTDLLKAFVHATYRQASVYDRLAVRVTQLDRNPHLDHTCRPCSAGYCPEEPGHCDTCRIEVRGNCGHDGHIVEAVAHVTYSAKGYETVIGVSTCGTFAVWMD